MVLKVDVMEAKDLSPKDATGKKRKIYLIVSPYRSTPKGLKILHSRNLRMENCLKIVLLFPTGFSDPYCVLYTSSSQTQRFSTNVQRQTLTPHWEEHFKLFV